MCKHASFLGAAIVVAAALLGPTVGAHYLAQWHGESRQMAKAGQIAEEVMRRTEHTSAQVLEAFSTLAALRRDDPCSPEMIRAMEAIDAASFQLQAVGYVENGRVACSSLGRDVQGLALGKPDYTTAKQIAVRKAWPLPRKPAVSLLVVTDTRTGFTAFVHPDMPIDVAGGGDHLSVGVLGASDKAALLSHGSFSTQWPASLQGAPSATFLTASHVVALRRSARYDLVAYAALPIAEVHADTARTGKVLVPAGLVAGVLLAIALMFLVRQRLAMPAMIRQGLKRNEFYLEYQPIVHLQTGRWVGAEALLRWRRRNGEVIRPDLFIPVAEEMGLMRKITRRVCKLVQQDAAGLFVRHPACRLSINLSAEDMHSPASVDQLLELSRVTGAGPGNLVVEATERGFMQAELAGETVDRLRRHGFMVAMDDFGTGYSSLSYLENFNMDYLKIDKSFIDTIDTDAPASHVVPHIIALARDLDLMMVAEGVETAAQATFLRSRGVQYGQGWLFGKPMRFSEFLRLFQQHGADAGTCADLQAARRAGKTALEALSS
jgi:sensor c-di-GMP phosphodiesterase-like protein